MSNSDAVNDLIDHEEDHNMAFWEHVHGLCHPILCYYRSQPQEGNKMTTPTHMPFGRYKGKKISEVPSDYLDWALKNLNDDHLLCAIEQEYEIREETYSHFYSED